MLPAPPTPEPHTIEIEATNRCSAACTFCPHSTMTRPKGSLCADDLARLLDEVDRWRPTAWLNDRAGEMVFPRINFAGLGEPTLHDDLPLLVSLCSERGYSTQVVTNGSHLTASVSERLLEVGLDRLVVSLHTLDPEAYWNLMRLRLSRTLPNVLHAMDAFLSAGREVELWRVRPLGWAPEVERADEARFAEMLRDRPGTIILGPSDAWERDGTVDSVLPLANDTSEAGIWCHNLFFSLPICWDGEVPLCCVDYHRVSVPGGNAFRQPFSDILAHRRSLYEARDQGICRTCTKWVDTEYRHLVDRYFPRER